MAFSTLIDCPKINFDGKTRTVIGDAKATAQWRAIEVKFQAHLADLRLTNQPLHARAVIDAVMENGAHQSGIPDVAGAVKKYQEYQEERYKAGRIERTTATKNARLIGDFGQFVAEKLSRR